MVDPHEIPNYYHHDDWRSIIHECFSTINVNGVKGWGIAEHCYRYAKCNFECFILINGNITSVPFITDRIRSMGEGNVFTGACHSVYRGGVHPGCTPP